MKKYKSTIQKYSLIKEPTEINKVKISNSQNSNEYLRKIWSNDIGISESFYVLFLNQSNNTIGYKCISQGGITSTIVDIRLIAKYAIESLATSIILAHNHPSGILEASQADKTITDKIQKALKLFDISLLDHIILTEESYLSFADEGIL